MNNDHFQALLQSAAGVEMPFEDMDDMDAEKLMTQYYMTFTAENGIPPPGESPETAPPEEQIKSEEKVPPCIARSVSGSSAVIGPPPSAVSLEDQMKYMQMGMMHPFGQQMMGVDALGHPVGFSPYSSMGYAGVGFSFQQGNTLKLGNGLELDNGEETLEKMLPKTPRKRGRKKRSRPSAESTKSRKHASAATETAVAPPCDSLLSVSVSANESPTKRRRKIYKELHFENEYDSQQMWTAFEYIRQSGIVGDACEHKGRELVITNSDTELQARIPFSDKDMPLPNYTVAGSLIDVKELVELFQPRDRGHYTMGLTKGQKLDRRKQQNRQAAYRARRRAQFLNATAVLLNSENIAMKNFISEQLQREETLKTENERLRAQLAATVSEDASSAEPSSQ